MEFRQFEELVFESMLKDDVPHEELRDYARQQYFEMRRLMAYYRCAVMEIETKCNVINEDFSYRYERNPIQSIKSRLKTPQSIFDKLKRRAYPISAASIEANLSMSPAYVSSVPLSMMSTALPMPSSARMTSLSSAARTISPTQRRTATAA